MKRKDFYLTEYEIDQLNKEAKKLGITFSELLRRVVDRHLEVENDKNKQRKN